MSANPNVAVCPEHWQLFELITEGTTELNAHVKQHVETGCTSCNGKLEGIQTIERARVMKDEFDAFFDEIPSDDAPADEREKFLSQFKRKSRPADRLGRLSFDGKQIAAEIVKLAGEQGIDAAKSRIEAIEADPSRGYALLYAAQLAMPKVSSDPAMYVELAKAIAAASKSLPFLKDKGPAQPVCREQVMGEAQLLESNALNYLGKCAESRAVAQAARVSFVEAGEDTFALALADYFEGSAASFEGDWASAWKLLRRALGEFQLYGQENWAGRTEASLGVLLTNRNRNESALHFYNGALQNLHPVLDEVVYANTSGIRPSRCCSSGGWKPRRRPTPKALGFARRLDLKLALFSIRYGPRPDRTEEGTRFKALQLLPEARRDAHAGSRSSPRDPGCRGCVRSGDSRALRPGRRGRHFQGAGRSRCRVPRGPRSRRSEGVQAFPSGGQRKLIFL
ncbi:MAG: hypothetical protein IPL89_16250 [Acidobacteria bacterium]|nr:hypothetical protein [Acidobacteriota bacterium]